MELNDKIYEIAYKAFQHKGNLSYAELTALVNKQHGWDLNPEQFRGIVRRYRARHEATADRDIFRDLEIRKQQFRDERNAWQKQNREQARTEANIDLLSEKLLEISPDKFVQPIIPDLDTNEEKTLLILLTDWHIGGYWQNKFGEYSYEIAVKRIQNLLREIQKIQNLHSCEACVVLTLGDMINGAIRRTTQLQNRENVVEQTKNAIELLTNFCYVLCKMFADVTLTGCAGNHSRLVENKEDAVKDDRLDTIITWATAKSLKHLINFHYVEALDTTLTSIKIYGLEFIGVHGDYDRFTRNGVHSIITALHRFPYAVCYGHMHSPAMQESDGVLLIRGGSLCGTGDDYTISKRITGPPSQTLCVVSPRGVESIHPVML